MSDTETPITPEFVRWYQSVCIGKDPELHQKRWEALIKLVANANQVDVENLIRLAYKTRQKPTQEGIQGIRQYFLDFDDSFEMTGNEREVQVLAGAALAVLMNRSDSDEAERTALAVTTTALSNGRSVDLPVDLSALGEQSIELLSEKNRRRPSLEVSAKAPEFNFENSVTKVAQTPNWEGVKEAFELAAASTSEALRKLAIRQMRAMNNVAKFIEVQDEELQMLWWLIGQHSEEYDCPFNKVPPEAQPFVFARELADATEVLPGPRSIKAMLSRTLQKQRSKIRVSDAVNALQASWLESAVEEREPSPVITPLHYAIKRQLETGEGDAWIAGWAAAAGVEQDFKLSRITLGELFYRERLLMLFE